MRKLMFLFACLLLAVPCPAGIIYVDANTPDNNDGSSWAKAYKYLQDALTAAQPGDEIWVAEGTYTPDSNSADPNGSGDREAIFRLIVAIYGGFAGGETSLDERDWQINETILSGDLDGNDVQVDPCDLLSEPTRAENSYHVVTGSGTAILDGFTITAGNANGGWHFETGGGMVNGDSSPTVTNCTFSGNSAITGGGGMNNEPSSSPTVTNCTFSGNWASWGGGMYSSASSSPRVTNCTFSGNAANWGGGMGTGWSSFPRVTNCTFSGNSANGYGGGMVNWGTNSSPRVTNCTFSGNLANSYGGGMYNSGGNPTLTNCILWGNTASDGNEIALFGSTIDVNYCDIKDGNDGIYNDGSYTINWGNANMDADPNFANAASDDYHLKSQAGRWDTNTKSWVTDSNTSQCIDAGSPNSDWSAELWPHGKRINMGVYGGTPEASMSLSDAGNIANLDNDPADNVDFNDLDIFVSKWCEEEVLIVEDLNRDGVVNFVDYAIFADEWLW